ncbi:MAG: dihydropteroate synthase [Microthrixaceae bacterium]
MNQVSGEAGGPEANQPLIMGVLNTTPDSFSDGGAHLDPDEAVAAALRMIADGADVIDIGGESTRPGAAPVSPADEQRRVMPVVEALAAHPDAEGTRLSIDTRNAETAVTALAAGATLLNDVSASLFEQAAEAGAGWVAMHMAGSPATMQAAPRYGDVVSEVRSFLSERVERAERAGVSEIWVDPGIGFGKTTGHNVALLANVDAIAADGRPVLIGCSRKRSLGVLLARSDQGSPSHPGPSGGSADFDEVEPLSTAERLTGSLTTASWAIIGGAHCVRAHDVGATAHARAALAGVFNVSRRY